MLIAFSWYCFLLALLNTVLPVVIYKDPGERLGAVLRGATFLIFTILVLAGKY